MKKLIDKISKLKERRSITKMHALTKGINREEGTTSNIDMTVERERANSIGARIQTQSPMKSGETIANEVDEETTKQNDSQQCANVYLIENYAELLVQKLRPLNSNNTRSDYYTSNDFEA
jgi:hypothetical protein